MLGVQVNPYFTNSDKAMREIAEEMGVGNTFTMAPLGVHFGNKPGEIVADPYFGGVGPDRVSCLQCGGCMTGCRHNAKNTLPKNYLGLAESAGAEVLPLTTVTSIEQRDGGWFIAARKSNSWFSRKKYFTADQVIVAAGTYNTQKLLHKMKSSGKLPEISDRLGELSRTNSESLVGAIMPNTDIDFSHGAAITSSFYPDEHTHVEPVRYGKGSNLMGLLQTAMTDGSSVAARRKQWLRTLIRKPSLIATIMNVKRWSERTVIALVMQDVDSAIRVKSKRFFFGWRLTSENDAQRPNATYIPAANETARRIANRYGGIAGGHIGDLVNAPFTAHFVGGCVIGKNPEEGVIDPYHRVWNYPTLHVIDGSTITANLGVNPSLTITAQAERAISLWPNKGDADFRPIQGAPYARINSIPPRHPVVPINAPAALKIVP
jgi:cholesterol oxidase